MKRGIALLWALTLMIASPVWAGYKELIQGWEKYEPTPFYDSYAKPEPAPDIRPTPSDADFKKQVEQLQEIKARWEQALSKLEKEGVFYRPDPSLLETLSPSTTNPAIAQEVLRTGFTLEDLNILAFLRNPDAKAAEDRFRATLEMYSQVWNLDEILRQYTAFTEDLKTGIGPMKGREPIEKRFPFPGVMALKGEIVTQAVKAARETWEIARRTAITTTRKAYWNLLFNRKAIKITEETLRLLRRLENVATTRYETGRTSFQDVIKIQIEIEKLDEELNTLNEQRRNLEVEILKILNLPPTARVGAPRVRIPNRSVPNLDSIYPIALQSRQELKRLRAQVGKMERTIEMAETAIYPSYALNLSLFQDEAISQVGTFREKEPYAVTTTASVGAGLPKMPWYASNDAYLRETKQKLKALREDLKNAEDQTELNVRDAWFRLDRAKRDEALYADRVVKLSQSALEVSTQGYQTGAVTFADVIGSYTGWLEDNLMLERKRSDLGVFRAELEAAIGAPLKQ